MITHRHLLLEVAEFGVAKISNGVAAPAEDRASPLWNGEDMGERYKREDDEDSSDPDQVKPSWRQITPRLLRSCVPGARTTSAAVAAMGTRQNPTAQEWRPPRVQGTTRWRKEHRPDQGRPSLPRMSWYDSAGADHVCNKYGAWNDRRQLARSANNARCQHQRDFQIPTSWAVI